MRKSGTIFDQEWSRETKEGIIAEILFRGTNVKEITIHPLRITNYGYAQLSGGPEKAKILDVFTSASRELTKKTENN